MYLLAYFNVPTSNHSCVDIGVGVLVDSQEGIFLAGATKPFEALRQLNCSAGFLLPESWSGA
jgi:hypothetical protein